MLISWLDRYLIEGFDNDDMYIMVEDEFYAVAQSFTRHLHHAEYVRRKKEAKLRNAAAIKDLPRPTDGQTAMREETKRRKESEALHARQRSGLERTRGKRPRVDSEEEEDSDLDEDKEDDPWVGTSLHGLMTSPRKARSFVGLQGIKSTTRAAAGYSQTSGSDSRDRYQLPSSPPPPPPARQKEPETHNVGETASDDDDNLEIQPSKVTTVSRRLPQTKTPIKAEPASPLKPEIHSREESNRPSPRLETNKINSRCSKYNSPSVSNLNAKMKMLFDELDELPERRSHDSVQDQTQDSDSACATPQRHVQGDSAKSKKSYLNEVPTFLF